MTDHKIKEAFAKEVWSDTVWEGCGPTALDIYQAGYMACLNGLELYKTYGTPWGEAETLVHVYRLPEGVTK